MPSRAGSRPCSGIFRRWISTHRRFSGTRGAGQARARHGRPDRLAPAVLPPPLGVLEVVRRGLRPFPTCDFRPRDQTRAISSCRLDLAVAWASPSSSAASMPSPVGLGAARFAVRFVDLPASGNRRSSSRGRLDRPVEVLDAPAASPRLLVLHRHAVKQERVVRLALGASAATDASAVDSCRTSSSILDGIRDPPTTVPKLAPCHAAVGLAAAGTAGAAPRPPPGASPARRPC